MQAVLLMADFCLLGTATLAWAPLQKRTQLQVLSPSFYCVHICSVLDYNTKTMKDACNNDTLGELNFTTPNTYHTFFMSFWYRSTFCV